MHYRQTSQWKALHPNRFQERYRVVNGYIYKGTKRLHRLIYERYIGPIPKGYDVHHIDGNKQRNCLSNLELISHRAHVALHHKRGDLGIPWMYH
jgi:hypothetical protein